jgi:hypothetical protein
LDTGRHSGTRRRPDTGSRVCAPRRASRIRASSETSRKITDPAGNCSRWLEQERTRPFLREVIPRVAQPTYLQRQTPTPYAAVQFAAQLLECSYPAFQVRPPFGRQPFPVRCGRSATARQRVHCFPDRGERQPQTLCHFNDGNAAQNIPAIAPLIPRTTPAAYQALGFVEMDGRHGHGTTGSHLSGGQRTFVLFGCYTGHGLTSSMVEVLHFPRWRFNGPRNPAVGPCLATKRSLPPWTRRSDGWS